ncbi:MAG TPA: M48 family metallopeptidase [Patescibacteria group bacterium]|nr:M48 family metallopeptidase [Patescibacteria group bacterium]
MLATEGFAAHVWGNQVRSILLLLGFPFLLLLMLAAFFAALGATSGRQPGALDTARAWDSALYGITHYGHWAILGALGWFVIAYFFHGRMMRAATGSQPITRAEMPKIYNMLENLCISRGIPMPQFEIIDSPALNAFATGIDEKSYRIVLTRGIVERLQDDELEAVIAHELSHIRNRDVRLLIISVIFVGMISFLCQIVFRMLVYGGRPNYYQRHSSRRDDNGGGAGIMLIGLAILAIGYVFAIAIRFALSRKREYLADAGSIELTKNPEAMMRALMRISGQDQVKGLPNEVAQMCIENSVDFMGMFATHPKIEDRIAVISRTTGTPVPALPVSLRRAPESPWDDGRPPQAPARPWG